jgi:DNA-binding transcriptional LysR family regulator
MWSTGAVESGKVSDRRLSYFVTLVEQRGFARAAEVCGISQSALSQQIVRLETDIGAVLLDRTVRPFGLTPIGARVYDLALDILNGYRELTTLSGDSIDGEIGRVRIGIVPSLLFLSRIPAAVRSYRELYPGVDLDLRRMDNVAAVDKLFDRHLDVIVSFSKIEGKGLSGRLVDETEYLIALPDNHPRAAEAAVGLYDLRDETFVTFPRDAYSEGQDDLVHAAQELGFSPRMAPVHATFIELTGFVAAGFGVALMPASLAAFPVTGTVFRPLRDTAIRLRTHLFWREELAEPAVRQFVEHVVSELGAVTDAT